MGETDYLSFAAVGVGLGISKDDVAYWAKKTATTIIILADDRKRPGPKARCLDAEGVKAVTAAYNLSKIKRRINGKRRQAKGGPK